MPKEKPSIEEGLALPNDSLSSERTALDPGEAIPVVELAEIDGLDSQ